MDDSHLKPQSNGFIRLFRPTPFEEQWELRKCCFHPVGRTKSKSVGSRDQLRAGPRPRIGPLLYRAGPIPAQLRVSCWPSPLLDWVVALVLVLSSCPGSC
ncbi:hypothetical protein NL676_037076 [Syzygium grande]|nr:hypothetical protein NL676_037076 [Syzygium grande]